MLWELCEKTEEFEKLCKAKCYTDYNINDGKTQKYRYLLNKLEVKENEYCELRKMSTQKQVLE